jgi:hypothetical protein
MNKKSHNMASKAPNKRIRAQLIVTNVIHGIRAGFGTATIAEKLNGFGILTITKKRWTVYSLQMQILKMARFDSRSTLAMTLNQLIEYGDITRDDIGLLDTRVRTG